MREVLQVTLGVAAAAAIGTAYVLIHEQRRKVKAERKRVPTDAGSSSDGESNGLTRARLIAILDESATAAYQLIEQVQSTTLPNRPGLSRVLRMLASAPPLSSLTHKNLLTVFPLTPSRLPTHLPALANQPALAS